MTTHNYKKLLVYEKSMSLAVRVIKLADTITQKRLAAQMTAACISIPSNIAEGARRSGRNEFCQFLEYSNGSAAELQTQLRILRKAELGNHVLLDELIDECELVCKMLSKLYSSIRQ